MQSVKFQKNIIVENDLFAVGNTLPEDFNGIIELTKVVYPSSVPWTEEQLLSHHTLFPEGQLAAYEKSTGKVVGMAASLILDWDDYDADQSWRDFTKSGMFTNHDPVNGKTLYGAEVMVHPDYRGKKIGKLLYEARRQIVYRLGLKRIRAGARMRGYGTYVNELSPKEYADKVAAFEIYDPTVSFQLKQGFKIIGLVDNYLRQDPESMGHAAIIEWVPNN